MIPAPLVILWEFYAAKRRIARLRTRADVERHQERLLVRQLSRLAGSMPFYRSYRGRPLGDWPVMDKAAVNAHFADLNEAGITFDEAKSVAAAALSGRGTAKVKGLIAGLSTGTSGNRGVYVITGRERLRWLGVMLAKAVQDFPRAAHRVAVLMPGGAQLYGAAGESRRIRFAFFDIREGVERHRAGIEAFDPDIVVAPPKALRLMAGQGFRIAPRQVFSGGEVLDPMDSSAVAERYGVTVRSIYQATEGFLGIACSHGTIHLNEDVMHFEREPVLGAGEAFVPLITDLLRTGQAMVRYRMNDVLVPAGGCPCGSPLQPLVRIEGRSDDVVLLPGPDGRLVSVMPSVLRDAILDAGPSIADFRAVQTGPSEVEVRLPEGTDRDAGAAVAAAVSAACRRSGANDPAVAITTGIEPQPFDRKLRRVERRWQPER